LRESPQKNAPIRGSIFRSSATVAEIKMAVNTKTKCNPLASVWVLKNHWAIEGRILSTKNEKQYKI
jgi:hypothetical protein